MTLDAQTLASDPARSAWVEASAGSGKTHVLTRRLLRLLLAGAAPGRILCLTFTRAAAAEMSKRLFAELAAWARAESPDLAPVLGRAPTQAEVTSARRLFAIILDVPGGMRIETLHGFCQSLLARFPLEAGIPPHFKIASETTAADLLREARNAVLAGRESSRKVAAALEVLAAELDEDRFDKIIGELIRNRRRLSRLLAGAGGEAGLIARIWENLGLPNPTKPQDVIEKACAQGAFDRPALKSATMALLKGSKTDRQRGETIAAWLAASGKAGRIAAFPAYAEAFLAKEGHVRDRLVTKAVATPDLLDTLGREAERLRQAIETAETAAMGQASAALARLGGQIMETYQALKRRHGVLDYDDLIIAARRLLERPGIAPWVLFKLDGGIDHVLVDEAQDTSPDQWAVVRTIADEFFAGAGAREGTRTVFAVGDPKQSIYGFQDADPEGFEEGRTHFRRRAGAAGADFASVDMALSYRSVPAVLRAVDLVFADPAAKPGVIGEGTILRHATNRGGDGGKVELWPLETADGGEGETTESWPLPVVQEDTDHPAIRLAVKIGDVLKGWIGREPLPGRGRVLRAGDVLILVRRRDVLVDALVRRLKQLGIPVAGADRLILTDHIAVADVLSLFRFLLQPGDDLALAEALKSPLFGYDDDDLFAVAHGREGSLWSSLRARRPGNPATRRLAELLSRADFIRPHELIASLLVPEGRRRFVGRLGAQAEEVLDEMLARALAYERDNVPTLQGFVAWLSAGEAEIKRDLEQGRDEVRIMTVHGAKGLEAPIVFLPDTARYPKALDALFWDERAVYWPGRGRKATPDLDRLKARRDRKIAEDYNRLLYVALTRAADRLVICGWSGKPEPDERSWYAIARRALGEGLEEPQTRAVQIATSEAKSAPLALPAWIERGPPPEPAPPVPLAPSRLAEEPPALPGRVEDPRPALRGKLIHRLLQSLPELEPKVRAAAARRFLSRPAHGLGGEEIEAMLGETLGLLDHPDFAAVFAPDSLAEVPVAGLVDGLAISGQIDRLARVGDRVLVVDYKTGREPPTRVEDVPEAYLAQMAAYAACLAAIHPGKRIEAALLWTATPRLMPLPDSLLAAHAPGVKRRAAASA